MSGETRYIICPDCGGEGLWEVQTSGYDPRDGTPNHYTKVCETCAGSCGVEIEVDPITLEDLDSAALTKIGAEG